MHRQIPRDILQRFSAEGDPCAENPGKPIGKAWLLYRPILSNRVFKYASELPVSTQHGAREHCRRKHQRTLLRVELDSGTEKAMRGARVTTYCPGAAYCVCSRPFLALFPVRQRRFAGLLIGALRPSLRCRLDAGAVDLNLITPSIAAPQHYAAASMPRLAACASAARDLEIASALRILHGLS